MSISFFFIGKFSYRLIFSWMRWPVAVQNVWRFFLLIKANKWNRVWWANVLGEARRQARIDINSALNRFFFSSWVGVGCIDGAFGSNMIGLCADNRVIGLVFLIEAGLETLNMWQRSLLVISNNIGAAQCQYHQFAFRSNTKHVTIFWYLKIRELVIFASFRHQKFFPEPGILESLSIFTNNNIHFKFV